VVGPRGCATTQGRCGPAPRTGRLRGDRPTLQAYCFLAPLLAVLLGLRLPACRRHLDQLHEPGVGRAGAFVGLPISPTVRRSHLLDRSGETRCWLTVGAVGTKLVLGLAAAVLLMQPFPLRNLVRALTFCPGGAGAWSRRSAGAAAR